MPFIKPAGSLSKIREEEVTVLDVTPEEQPHQRQKDRRPLAKLLKESHWEAFSKDSKIINTARQAYYPSQKGIFALMGPMISHWFSGRWPLLLAFLTLMSTKSRMTGLARMTSGPPIRKQKAL